ncbi:MAG: hypothetical protein J3K34DRAFT_492384 [Monoraphidium minutum]|nr:MAG: hypothetical protein J3K34DRAFT_492384 [Monoraphidium minutum]
MAGDAARAAPPRGPGAAGALPRPAARLVGLALLHVAAALVFSRGFLLTRVELPDIATCPGPGCPPAHHAANADAPAGGARPPSATPGAGAPPAAPAQAAYDRAVILIVDALRFDFVCGNRSAAAPHAGAFPNTMALVSNAGDAAAVLRFVADTPTITMSRLKALLTGGLPTFLDVGSSFSASEVREDNLLAQLKAAGKAAAFVGDDTWQQLSPGAFEWAWPYPSFNVKDLHSVDDGVWQRVLPLLRGRAPAGWAVLIGHYLGVDHAGHSHGVRSRQMARKVAQMDAQVAAAIELVAQGAGPGGPYERTLLLVVSDHGQTLGGDHGGGTPDETDSVLIAVSPAKLHARLALGGADSGGGARAPLSEARLDELQASLLSDGWAARRGAAAEAATAPAPATELVCGGAVPQVDLTPALALMLGLPIPFGNLGKVPKALWAVLAPPPPPPPPPPRAAQAAAAEAEGADASIPAAAAAAAPAYVEALAANAAQVHRYLNRYAAAAKLPARPLARCNRLFAAAAALDAAGGGGAGAPDAGDEGVQAQAAGDEAGRPEAEAKLEAAWTEFLDAAAALARGQFTQFHAGFIWAGVAAMGGAAALHLLLCWRALHGASGGGGPSWEARALAALQAGHALSLFSVGALMGEGRLQAQIINGATLLLARSALAAALRAGCAGAAAPRGGTAARRAAGHEAPGGGAAWRVLALCGALLACNAALQEIGLIDRFGKDPHDKTEPSTELLGPGGGGGAAARARHLAAALAPLAAGWLLWAGAAAWLERRCRGGGKGGRGGGGDALAAWVAAAARGAAAGEYLAIAAFWWAQLSGGAELEGGDAVARALGALGLGTRGAGGGGVARWLGGGLAAAAALRLPLRLLLPRTVYALALGALAAAALAAAALALGAGRGGGGSGSGGARPRAVLWLVAAASGPVIMVLGYKGPAIIFLGAAQAACLLALLSLRARAIAAGSAAPAPVGGGAGWLALALEWPAAPRGGGRPAQGAAAGAAAPDDASGLAALLFGMYALQLFFCSGHFCEFSGLQYASSFIGYDEMIWYVSGPLLLVNTFGPSMLVYLALPLAAAALAPAAAVGGGGGGGGGGAALAGPLLLASGGRAAALVACAASAAVQQGHILLWAIFAPKLVFEMWLSATAHGALLLAAWLAPAA